MGNKCISNANVTNPINMLDNMPATCYISVAADNYIIYYPTLKEAYKFGEAFIDSPLYTSEPRIGFNIIKKTSYQDIYTILQKDVNSFILVDNDAFTKVYIYLTNTIHNNIKKSNPSIENPYSLLYKLNKL
jgi:hypothetical protein